MRRLAWIPVIFLACDSRSGPERQLAEAKTKALRENKVNVADARCYHGGGGPVLMLDLALLADMPGYFVSDVRVACNVLAPSGSIVARVETIVLEDLPDGRWLQKKGLNLGFVDPQFSTCDCRVVDFVLRGGDPLVLTPMALTKTAR